MRILASAVLCVALVSASNLSEYLGKRTRENDEKEMLEEYFTKIFGLNSIPESELEAIGGILGLSGRASVLDYVKGIKLPETALSRLAPLQFLREDQRDAVNYIRSAIFTLDFSIIPLLPLANETFEYAWIHFIGVILKVLSEYDLGIFLQLLNAFPQLKRVSALRELFNYRYPELAGTQLDYDLFGNVDLYSSTEVSYKRLMEASMLFASIKKFNIDYLRSLVLEDDYLNVYMPKIAVLMKTLLWTTESKEKFIQIVEALPQLKKRPEISTMFYQRFPNDTGGLARITELN